MSPTFPLHTEGNIELSLDEINHDHYDVDMKSRHDYLMLQHLSPDEVLAIASKIICAMCQSHLDKAEVTVANLTKDIHTCKRGPK
jgi:hypothetical protein